MVYFVLPPLLTALRPLPTIAVQVSALEGPDTLLVATSGTFSANVEPADSATV